ncbi:MAG: sodium/solute symporter [Planctomycetales bacterium]|nr:sodium/solute symporter [Planctomycetales bacterium]
MGELQSIDYLIIGTYMLGVLSIGSYFAKYIHSTGDFFLAGRALPFWAIGMSIVVTDIGAIDLLTGAGAAYDRGIAQANFDWIGSVPALLLAAFIFVPYYWRAGVYTLPEFLGRRYNSATRWVHALVLLFFMLATVSIMLWTSAVFLRETLGWNEITAIWVTAAIVGCYAISGGLAAVVMTDVMQLVVMFVGTGALLALALWEVGGWSGLSQKILAQPNETEAYFQLLVEHREGTQYPWPGMVFSLGIIMSTAYFVGNQAVMQRALGARSEWDAKAGMLTAALFKLAIPILVFLPGMAARGLFPDLESSVAAIPTLIDRLLPPGLKGLMFAAFFAALMSSVDSYLNSCVTIFTGDVYRPLHKQVTGRDLSGRLGLILGRSLTAFVLVAAAIYAPRFKESETLYDVLQTLLSMFQGPTLAILLLGIFWRGATAWGGFAGLVIGVALTCVLNILGDAVFISDNPYLFVSFWSFWVSLGVTISISLFTKKKTPMELEGLVYGSVLSQVTNDNV